MQRVHLHLVPPPAEVTVVKPATPPCAPVLTLLGVAAVAGLLGCRSPVRPAGETAPVVAVSEHVAPESPRPEGMMRERTPEAPIPGGLTTSAGRIALDKDRVYWVDGRAGTGPRLLSAPKGGGAPVELATTPTAVSRSIAVDDAFVFLGYVGRDVPNPWRCPKQVLCGQHAATIPGPTGAVLAVPKKGGVPRVLVSDAHDPACVAADGKHVYWTDYAEGEGGLSRVPREGGRRALLLTDAWCRGLALDATHVYCGGLGISRVPKAGGVRENFVESGREVLALGTNAVYFASSLQVRRSVPRAPEHRCHPFQQAMCVEPDPMIDDVPILAVVPKTGGSPSPIVREKVGPHLVVDGRRAYWMDGERVMGVDLAGGAAVQVAEASGAAPGAGLAVDESRLYWVTNLGELRSAAK